MSSALASIKNKKVNLQQAQNIERERQQQVPVPPQLNRQVGFNPAVQGGFGGQPTGVVAPPRGTNLTAQQTFDLVFNRLNTLEKSLGQNNDASGGSGAVDEELLNSFAEEFNSRTEILANEIAELKDIILKVQSFTMEVNQKLFAQVNDVDA
jgi:hypothetical protein